MGAGLGHGVVHHQSAKALPLLRGHYGDVFHDGKWCAGVGDVVHDEQAIRGDNRPIRGADDEQPIIWVCGHPAEQVMGYSGG